LAAPLAGGATVGGGVVSGVGRVTAGVAVSGGRLLWLGVCRGGLLLWLGVCRGGWMLAARGRLDDGRELEAGVEWIGMGDFFLLRRWG
jgi:hypothetical protein